MSIEISKTLEEKSSLLEEKNGILKKENQFLHKRIEELEELVKKFTTAKPNQKDPTNPNQDKLIAGPETQIKHKLTHCQKCGKELTVDVNTEIGSYQILEISKLKPILTENPGVETKCSCGHIHPGLLEKRGVVYGTEVKGYISYFSEKNQ